MNSKIGNKEKFNEDELLLISLLCFMKSNKDMEHCILNSAVTISNIDCYGEIGQFVKEKSLNTTISNLVDGNMKIVEDYAQRKVDEKVKEFVINLDKKGFSIEDIAETAGADLDFIKKALSME